MLAFCKTLKILLYKIEIVKNEIVENNYKYCSTVTKLRVNYLQWWKTLTENESYNGIKIVKPISLPKTDEKRTK